MSGAGYPAPLINTVSTKAGAYHARLGMAKLLGVGVDCERIVPYLMTRPAMPRLVLVMHAVRRLIAMAACHGKAGHWLLTGLLAA